MPPMARECCAFLGEIALIDYFEKRDTKLYQLLKQVWRNNNLKYLSSDVAFLHKAINDHSLKYSYDWNYPIARLYAVALRRQVNNKNKQQFNKIENLFASGSKAVEILIISQLSETLEVYNPLPEINISKKEGITKYQMLGAATALAMYDQNKLTSSIEEFYKKISLHIQKKTLFISFQKGKPVAYACWKTGSKGGMLITDICVRFSDINSVKKSLYRKYNKNIEIPKKIMQQEGVN